MKIGIIGCGGMGTTHYLSLRALAEQEGVEVTCIAECRKEFLDKAASYFPNARTYEYGMDLIKNEELDIVHICLPSYMHAEHAIAALEKGMNVFVEKPVCLTEEDCQALLDAEKRSGKKVMVGQVVRSFKEYKFLKEAYDSGRYGKLKSMVMQRISGDVRWGFENWFQDERKSGSVVLDLHVHDLDFIRYMLGEPKSMDVKATEFPSGMVNQIVASYEYDDTFVTAEGIWDISPSLKFHATYRACFEKATLVFDSGATPSLEIYKPDGACRSDGIILSSICRFLSLLYITRRISLKLQFRKTIFSLSSERNILCIFMASRDLQSPSAPGWSCPSCISIRKPELL